MFVKIKISFTNQQIPTKPKVLETLKGITGLDVTLNEKGDEFIHDIFKDRGFNFYYEREDIIITTGWPDSWYLLEALVASLVSMGGKSDYEVADWAWKNWDEVKELNTHREF